MYKTNIACLLEEKLETNLILLVFRNMERVTIEWILYIKRLLAEWGIF